MNKNLGTFFGLSRCGVGAVVVALCAFTPVSRADVIVDNLPDAGGAGTFPTLTAYGQGLGYLAEVFTMSSANGDLGSVTLNLNFYGADSATVYIYNTSVSGAPTTPLDTIGTVTSSGAIANDHVTISGLNIALNGTYAIVLGPDNGSGDMTWNGAAAGYVGSGSQGGAFFYGGASWNQYGGGMNFQMNLQTTPVPEVPVTGVVMGFGALAIALGRKLRVAVSNVG